MEARVAYSPREGEDQKSVFAIDPSQDETVDDLRQRVAADFGLSGDTFRLVLASDRTVLEGRQLLRELQFQNHASASSDSDPGEEPEEEASAVSEKSQQDSVEAEKNGKSAIKQKTKLLMSVFNKYMRESEENKDGEGDTEGAEAESTFKTSLYDKMFKSLRHEVYTVMRMSREDTRLQIPEDGVPNLQVVEIEVQEGYPVYFITANDELQSIACLGDDTMASVKTRAAALYNCPVDQFHMHKINEAGDVIAQADAEVTLNEIGMGENDTCRQFYAYCTGTRKLLVMFGFCICQEIEINMDKPVRRLRKRITRVAPDLRYVKFFMCYNDISLVEKEKSTVPLGKMIMGGDVPIRIVIEFDFDFPYELDPGPELTLANANDTASLSREERLRRFQERKNRGGFKAEATQPSEKRRQYSSSEGSNGNEPQLHFNVNKRALTHFTILIECHKFDDIGGSDENKIDPDYDNKANYEAPITLKGLTARTRFYEIRDMIAKITNESCFHQILYKNGELFDSKDDCKTLRELDMIPSGTDVLIYKEPSITVNIQYKDVTVPVIVAGRGTSFKLLADSISYDHHDKIPLRPDQILFEHNGVMVPQSSLFSDFRICHGDEIKVLSPFRIRVWLKCYAFDNDKMWSHTHPKELREFVAEKTKIAVDKQILVLIKEEGDVVLEINNKLSMADLGIDSNCEMDVFTQEDLPSRLHPNDGGIFIESKKSSDEDSNPEEPDGAKAQVKDEQASDDEEDDEDDDFYDPGDDK